MAKETRTGGRAAAGDVVPGQFAISVGHPGTCTVEGFRWLALSDVARLESGHTPSRAHPEYWDGEIPWIGIRDATGNHGLTLDDTEQHVTEEGIENSSARILPEGTVCLSRTASVGYVVSMGRPMATSQDFVNWVCGAGLVPKYLHYVLMLEQDSIRRFAHGTTHQTMYYPEAKALHILAPAVREQQAIAEVLGALDDKIAANRELIARSAELATVELRRACAGGFRDATVGEVATFHNRRRIPLSSRQREQRRGSIPYYGAAGPIDTVDEAIFNDRLVLVGEDGTVTTGAGTPYVQYIWGPAWVNNHAHVLTGNGLSTELLRHMIADVRITDSITGAVQPKLSMGNLKAVSVRVPTGEHLGRLEEHIKALAAVERARIDENERLAATRDGLLPLLMSGKLRVKDAEQRVGEVV